MAAAAPADTPPVPLSDTREAPVAPLAQHPRQSHKSWRKKYYKMRHEFQRLMTRNQMQFEEEQKAMRMARRLQEQNDQVLDLLYDINRKPRLDTKLRYDIRSPVPSISPVPELEDDDDELEDTLTYNPLRVLSRLDRLTPHTSMTDLPSDPQEQKGLEGLQDLIEDEPTGYLSPAHEEEYLAAVDAHEEKPRDYAPNQQRSYDGPTGPWSTRDPTAAAANNPVSVFNWLRKHMPDSLETTEKGVGPASKDDKTGSKPAPTKVMPKRASVGAKHEYGDVIDDDGTVVRQGPEVHTPGGSGKGRKRAIAEEDGAYRPKGGSGRKKKKMSVGDKSERALGLPVAHEPAPES